MLPATIAPPRPTILLHPAARREQDGEFADDEVVTLRTFYERRILPELRLDASAGSLKEDRIAINHWERETDDPDIRDATVDQTRQLLERLQRRGLSPATINKTWRELLAMFNWARDERLIDQVPYLSRRHKTRLVKEPPKRQRETLTFDEVERLWTGCRLATYPAGPGPAPLKWRVALVLFWAYGARTRDVFGLDWSDVLFSDQLIRLEAMKTSKLQGLPMLPYVERWLRELNYGQRSGPVLSGFHTKGHQWRTGRHRGEWKRGYVRRKAVLKFGLPAASKILKQLWPWFAPGPLDDAFEPGPEVLLWIAEAGDDVDRPRRRLIIRGFEMRLQFREQRHSPEGLAGVMGCLRAADGETAATPINVIPRQREQFRGTSQTAVTAERNDQPPLSIGTRLDDSFDHMAGHEEESITVRLHR